MNLTERYSEKLYTLKATEMNMDSILVQIEVTNACNHKCVFCPNAESTRKKRMIDENFAKRVIRECAEFLGADKRICFHMNGEPLLYKRLPELVNYSKQQGYDYVFVTTNGTVGDEMLLSDLFEAGLDSIKFSINAGTKETYYKIHGADDFEKAINSLKFSWRYRKEHAMNFKIFVSCVGIKENYTELKDFNNFAKSYCDEIVFYYPCGYAGQKTEKSKELNCDLSKLEINAFEIKHNTPCAVLWNSINITCEGYLSLCCSESDNRLIVEDVNDMSVKDAWLGKRMDAIRAKHLIGKIEDTPCFSCITECKYNIDTINKDLFALSLNERRKRSLSCE